MVRQRNSKGFTLLELLVVVIIVGVLATLGFNRYIEAVERARMAEARDWAGQIRASEEREFLEVGAYTAIMADLDVDDPNAADQMGYYTYAVSLAPACADPAPYVSAFEVVATRTAARGRPAGPPADPNYTISVTQQGTICDSL